MFPYIKIDTYLSICLCAVFCSFYQEVASLFILFSFVFFILTIAYSKSFCSKVIYVTFYIKIYITLLRLFV